MMKLLLCFCLISFFSFSQKEKYPNTNRTGNSVKLLKWGDNKIIVYDIQIADDVLRKVVNGVEYSLQFRNEEYKYTTDIKSLTIGNKEDFENFVKEADSLLMFYKNINEGEVFSYNMRYFKVSVQKCSLGQPCILLTSDDGLGYIFINSNYIDRLKSVI